MTNEIKIAYHEYMQETAHIVNPKIEYYFEKHKKNEDLFKVLEPFIQKRLQTPQLRTVISRLAYEIVDGENWERITPVMAAMEIQTIYLYLHNWIFDNKNNIRSWDMKEIRKKINNITIVAAITREIISDAINDLNIASDKKLRIKKLFSESTEDVYNGQFLDVNLTIDRFNEFSSEKDFLKSYELKSNIQSWNAYGLSGYVWALLGNAPKKQEDAIVKICKLFGTGLHISNDLGDFSPPKETKTSFGKAYQDQLADIKENRLTLPIFSILKNGNEKEKNDLLRMVGNYQPKKEEVYNAIETIHTTNTFSYCKKYIRGYYKEAEKLLHENFNKSKERDFFSVMLSVIRSNKFLTELKNFNFQKNI